MMKALFEKWNPPLFCLAYAWLAYYMADHGVPSAATLFGIGSGVYLITTVESIAQRAEDRRR